MILLVLLFLLVSKAALAQPAYCVDPTVSWGHQYQVGDVQSVTYYKDQLIFSTIIRPGKIDNLHVHNKVPINVATGFQKYTDATKPYNTNIVPRYAQDILAQTGCPLLTEIGGYLLSSGICTPSTCLTTDWSLDLNNDFGPRPRMIS